MAFTLHNSNETYSTSTFVLNIFTSDNTTLSVLYLVYNGNRVGGDPSFTGNPMTLIDVNSYDGTTIEMWYILNDNIPKSMGLEYTIPNNNGVGVRAVGMTYDTPINVMTKYIGKVVKSGVGSPIDLIISQTPPSVSIAGTFVSGVSLNIIPNGTPITQGDLPLQGRYAVQYKLMYENIDNVNLEWSMSSPGANWIGIAATFTELVPPWVQVNGVNYTQIDKINSCNRSNVDDFNTIPSPPFY